MEYDLKVMGNGNGNGIRTIWDTRTYEDLDPLYTSPLGLKTLSPGGVLASSMSSNNFLYSFAAGVMGSSYAFVICFPGVLFFV